MSTRSGREAGSATAELALAIPAVVIVLAMGVGMLGAASTQVALQDATADAARLLGRGEDASVAVSRVVNAVSSARVSGHVEGDLVCVTASADARVGGWIHIPLQARSCALADGR